MTITRAQILANTGRWAPNTVAYSQSSTASPTGHRCDCSGFGEMCGGYPAPGLNTVGMLNEGHVYPIGWEQLQPADVIGRLGDGTEGNNGHVTIVVAVVGTIYTVMEQAIGGTGPDRTVYNRTYLESRGFKPYRFAGLREDEDMARLFKTADSATIWESNGVRRRARRNWPLLQAQYGQNPPIFVVASEAELEDAAGPVDQFSPVNPGEPPRIGGSWVITAEPR